MKYLVCLIVMAAMLSIGLAGLCSKAYWGFWFSPGSISDRGLEAREITDSAFIVFPAGARVLQLDQQNSGVRVFAQVGVPEALRRNCSTETCHSKASPVRSPDSLPGMGLPGVELEVPSDDVTALLGYIDTEGGMAEVWEKQNLIPWYGNVLSFVDQSGKPRVFAVIRAYDVGPGGDDHFACQQILIHQPGRLGGGEVPGPWMNSASPTVETSLHYYDVAGFEGITWPMLAPVFFLPVLVALVPPWLVCVVILVTRRASDSEDLSERTPSE